MVIEARAEMLPTDATTVFAYNPGTEPAVNIPVETMVPPPAAMLQAGEMGTVRPSASYPTAVICCVVPATSVAFGVTVMLTRVPGAVTPWTSHANVKTPAITTTISARALSAVWDSARKIRYPVMPFMDSPPAIVEKASVATIVSCNGLMIPVSPR